jgi:nitroimidazol reductase NimA-like FMN-containing flavoprotein (pyridoxamine 5'-phosphate oxidase superfamily)
MTTTPPSSTPLSSTARTRLRRYPQRARTDRTELYDVLDTGLICHVAAVVDGVPHVIPMAYGRVDDTLYLHGSNLNQVLSAARDGGQLCVTVTHVQGLVLANTLYHHSANFRCAVVYGPVRVVVDGAERVEAFRATAEQLVPGRAAELRPPSAKELSAVTVIALSLEEASVKVREGGPFHEPEEDAGIWAGVVPVVTTWGAPSPAEEADGIAVPEHVARLEGRAVRGRQS